jgi:hypothetical protein
LTRLKVGDGPDSRVPPVSARRKKKRGKGAVLGRRVAELGHLGRCTREKKKASGLIACGLKERKGRERERERKKDFVVFFFEIFFSNSFFKHSNFNQTKSMHLNFDAQALFISKLF